MNGLASWRNRLPRRLLKRFSRSSEPKLSALRSRLLSSLPEGFKPEKRLIDLAKELDKAYIPTRYPNAHPEGAPFELYTKAEAERLIGYAREVVKFCEDLLSKIR